MIVFTDLDDKPCVVNFDKIAHISSYANYALISFDNGTMLKIKESMNKIVEIIQEHLNKE